MLRAIERPTHAIAIATAMIFLVLTTGSAVAATGVTIQGVERDPRFGRAWLLATLPGEGHLRTTSPRLKAFAPPGELEGGFVRIPLIPKLPTARSLRSDGRALVTVTIYFRPTGRGRSETLQKSLTLVRRAAAAKPGPH